MQQTLSSSVTINGIGLHSGVNVTMTLHPAPVHHGIVFVRNDLPTPNRIPALWKNVVDTRLCTVIGNNSGATIGTIEHVMSALRGCKIDNALIEINAPEVPIMDGSAAPFVEAIERVGIVEQSAPRMMIKILRTVIVQDGDKFVRLSPAEESIFSGEIEFNHDKIGRQTFTTELVNGNYPHLLADSRTFCFAKDVEIMRANGLAQGGSLDNAIVLGEDGHIINPDGLRHKDEFIRHKLLDAVGDLYLAGAPIIGRYHGIRAGHAINNKVLHALFINPAAWTYVSDAEESKTAVFSLPQSVKPAYAYA